MNPLNEQYLRTNYYQGNHYWDQQNLSNSWMDNGYNQYNAVYRNTSNERNNRFQNNYPSNIQFVQGNVYQPNNKPNIYQNGTYSNPKQNKPIQMKKEPSFISPEDAFRRKNPENSNRDLNVKFDNNMTETEEIENLPVTISYKNTEIFEKKFEDKSEEVEEENKYEEKVKEVEHMKIFIEELVTQKDKEISSAEKKINELEEKITLISSNNNELVTKIQKNLETISQLENKLEMKENELKGAEKEISNLNNKLLNTHGEYDHIKSQFNQEISKYNSIISNLQQQIANQQTSIKEYSKEIEILKLNPPSSLDSKLKDKITNLQKDIEKFIAEAENWKFKYIQLESQVKNSPQRAFTARESEVNEEILNLNKEILRKINESHLATKLLHEKAELKAKFDYNSKNIALEKVQHENTKLLKENFDLKASVKTLSEENLRFLSEKDTFSNWKSQCLQLLCTIVGLGVEVESLRWQLDEYRSRKEVDNGDNDSFSYY